MVCLIKIHLSKFYFYCYMWQIAYKDTKSYDHPLNLIGCQPIDSVAVSIPIGFVIS